MGLSVKRRGILAIVIAAVGIVVGALIGSGVFSPPGDQPAIPYLPDVEHWDLILLRAKFEDGPESRLIASLSFQNHGRGPVRLCIGPPSEYVATLTHEGKVCYVAKYLPPGECLGEQNPARYTLIEPGKEREVTARFESFRPESGGKAWEDRPSGSYVLSVKWSSMGKGSGHIPYVMEGGTLSNETTIAIGAPSVTTTRP